MSGVLRSDFAKSRGDGFVPLFFGASLGTTQEVLDFAPHLFDGVEVGGIGWQEEDLGASSGD